jgi:hypothetical protein
MYNISIINNFEQSKKAKKDEKIISARKVAMQGQNAWFISLRVAQRFYRSGVPNARLHSLAPPQLPNLFQLLMLYIVF